MKKLVGFGVLLFALAGLSACGMMDSNDSDDSSESMSSSSMMSSESSMMSSDSMSSDSMTSDSMMSDSSMSTSDSSGIMSSSSGTMMDGLSVPLSEAMKKYEDKYPDSDITSVELESMNGSYQYKFEGMDNEKEYELMVDGESGDVSGESEKNLDADDRGQAKRDEEKLNTKDLMSMDRITQIAEKEADGTATDWSLEKDGNTMYWEIKVMDGSKETEVKVDAQSGKVMSSEMDD